MGGGLSKEDLDKKHIVIIGGGYGGTELGTLLLKEGIPFTLIDPKEYFHHNVAALRAAVDPNWMKKTVIDYKTTFGEHFVQGKVAKVDLENKQVHLEATEVEPIKFTDVVFAVGSTGPFPGNALSNSIEDSTNDYLKISNEIEKANNIVIVGGGAVGVELAGEIAEQYKLKQIILIHPNQDLVTPGFGDKFQANVRYALDAFKVQMVLDDRVEGLSDLTLNTCMKQTVRTQKGQVFESDMVIKCTGLAPNTSMTKSVFDESKFEGNRLKVNGYLQIEGYTNVYGIGDCVNTKEHKMAAHASTHAKLLASNFVRELKGQPLNEYKQAFNGMLATIGKSYGAGSINGWNFPSCAVVIAKGKTLFTPKFFAMMGQSEPN